jgi:hypothetical protein
MTEVEWLACEDPSKMLGFLYQRATATDRQYRLFAVACARDELDHASKTQNCFNFGRTEDPLCRAQFWDPVWGYEAAIRRAEAWADGHEP